jgi:hypothetical protein
MRYIGFIGWLTGFLLILLNVGLNLKVPDSFELPLGQLSSIAVDSEGNIYCGAQFYARIQVYNPEGRYLYGKTLDTNGLFWIRINSNDELEVAAARGNKRYIFDKDGNLLSNRSNVPNYTEGFDTKGKNYCYDQKRDITYQIRPILQMFFLGKHVVKKDKSGKETVIVQTPFLKWLFMGTFPAFFFMVFSVFISFVFDQKFQDKMLKVLSRQSVPKFLQPKKLKKEDSN